MPNGFFFRFDRRVTLTFLMALMMHMFALIVWATYLEARVGALESRSHAIPAISESLARVEERIGAVHEEVAHIRRQLEKFTDAAIKKR